MGEMNTGAVVVVNGAENGAESLVTVIGAAVGTVFGIRRTVESTRGGIEKGAALFRRRFPERVHGLLRAAWQDLLDPSKAG